MCVARTCEIVVNKVPSTDPASDSRHAIAKLSTMKGKVSLFMILLSQYFQFEAESITSRGPYLCMPGDINIAVLLTFRLNCEKFVDYSGAKAFTIQWAVREINSSPDFVFSRLNLTLGYIMADTCANEIKALHLARKFRPMWLADRKSHYRQLNACEIASLIDNSPFFFVSGMLNSVLYAATNQRYLFSGNSER